MHRSTLLAAAAAAAAAAGSVQAQNSVEIYGRFNLTLERVKAGDAKADWQMLDNSSRIGFRGSEDLGGGLKAGFVLEHGFDVQNGSADASFWGRQAELNLTSARLGMLRLGTYGSAANDATADWISMHNHDTGRSADRLYAYVQSDNHKIGYRTPALGGFWGEASVALSEANTAANGNGHRSYDAALNWGDGPLSVGAGAASNGDARALTLRVSYEIGSLTLGAYAQRDQDYWAAGKRNNFRLAAMVPIGSSELHANVGRAGKHSDTPDSQATQWTLAFNHNLSKRTKVYTYYTRLSDESGIYGGDSNSFALGVRHNF